MPQAPTKKQAQLAAAKKLLARDVKRWTMNPRHPSADYVPEYEGPSISKLSKKFVEIPPKLLEASVKAEREAGPLGESPGRTYTAKRMEALRKKATGDKPTGPEWNELLNELIFMLAPGAGAVTARRRQPRRIRRMQRVPTRFKGRAAGSLATPAATKPKGEVYQVEGAIPIKSDKMGRGAEEGYTKPTKQYSWGPYIPVSPKPLTPSKLEKKASFPWDPIFEPLFDNPTADQVMQAGGKPPIQTVPKYPIEKWVKKHLEPSMKYHAGRLRFSPKYQIEGTSIAEDTAPINIPPEPKFMRLERPAPKDVLTKYYDIGEGPKGISTAKNIAAQLKTANKYRKERGLEPITIEDLATVPEYETITTGEKGSTLGRYSAPVHPLDVKEAMAKVGWVDPQHMRKWKKGRVSIGVEKGTHPWKEPTYGGDPYKTGQGPQSTAEHELTHAIERSESRAVNIHGTGRAAEKAGLGKGPPQRSVWEKEMSRILKHPSYIKRLADKGKGIQTINDQIEYMGKLIETNAYLHAPTIRFLNAYAHALGMERPSSPSTVQKIMRKLQTNRKDMGKFIKHLRQRADQGVLFDRLLPAYIKALSGESKQNKLLQKELLSIVQLGPSRQAAAQKMRA